MENRDEDDETTLPRLPTLAFRNEVIKRVFAGESGEVKEEVEHHRNKLVTTVESDDPENDEEAARVAKARSYHE